MSDYFISLTPTYQFVGGAVFAASAAQIKSDLKAIRQLFPKWWARMTQQRAASPHRVNWTDICHSHSMFLLAMVPNSADRTHWQQYAKITGISSCTTDRKIDPH